MCPASSILLATTGDGFKPQKTHRRPQLAGTFNAETCCPTRAAARMIRSYHGLASHPRRRHRQSDPAGHSRIPTCPVLPEHGPGQDVPLAAVRAGAVEIGHFGEHAGCGRENSLARVGTGSGAWWAVDPPKCRWFTGNDAARHNSVSTGRNVTWRPEETGERRLSSRNCCRA
jgi:hypothetical protein